MKKLIIIILLPVLALPATAQDFAGYRSGNYTGVNAVFFNPANIADSRYRWDFNLFGLNASMGNNKASFRIKDFGNSFDGDSLKNQVFSDKAGPASGLVSFVVNGPSLFFNLDKRSAVALTTRGRTLVNIRDIDGKLARQLIDDEDDDPDFPYTINSSQNMIVNANAWTEFGLSYARVISDQGVHYFKGGITLKYLAGAANAYINIDKLNGTIDEDVLQDDTYLTNATGQIAMGFGGVNISDFDAQDLLKFKSRGFGGDIGFVYEYRPDNIDAQRRDLNKYKLKVGLALLDIGSIRYKKDISRSGGYSIHIPNGQRFYLSALADADIDHFKDTLNHYPQFFTEDGNDGASSYNVALPSTLQIDVDYHLHRGFYLNLAGQLALTTSKGKTFNSGYYNAVTLTPRYEGKAIGVYIPVSYNALTSLTAGFALRLGSLYFGSGSILSALISNSKQADIYFGIHIGGLQKHKEKRSDEPTNK